MLTGFRIRYLLQKGKTPPLKKRSALSVTLNYIWWWGSSSRDLESTEYLFIAIISRFTLMQSGSIC